ncbi:hypothetical protein L288_16420 [Sphingobium quisquiliarum P25]|uniref:EthD domain-containing protein n=1 Tax=Sphingobium quisquiliarum P25 TaxID=1329909 RepID=T0HYH3_9SPHN|nr:EthD family reductase [Sphingobium quisquiliarum]EQB02579.1 hypothetical protein L288_16420 [Sphingobium quisquiliarum P25]EZP74081.1 Ethyl tert-butyl ether degradation EthD [Sphingomonas paucimobilis]
MFKCIALLRRRPDISHEAFVDYYETQHARLILRLLPGILDYRRNYVEREGAFTSPQAPIDFDSVTEIRFADRAAYDLFLSKAAEPDIARQIAEDEANFLDRAATRMFVVEERASAPAA